MTKTDVETKVLGQLCGIAVDSQTIEGCMNVWEELFEVMAEINKGGYFSDSPGSSLDLSSSLLMKVGNCLFSLQVSPKSQESFGKRIVEIKGCECLLQLFKSVKFPKIKERFAIAIGTFYHGRIMTPDANVIIPFLISSLKSCKRTEDSRIFNIMNSLTHVSIRNSELLYRNDIMPLIYRFSTHHEYPVVQAAAIVFEEIMDAKLIKIEEKNGVLKRLVPMLTSFSEESFVLTQSPLSAFSDPRCTTMSHSIALQGFLRGIQVLLLNGIFIDVSLGGVVYAFLEMMGIVSGVCLPILGKTESSLDKIESSALNVLLRVANSLMLLVREEVLTPLVASFDGLSSILSILSRLTTVIKEKKSDKNDHIIFTQLAGVFDQVVFTGFKSLSSNNPYTKMLESMRAEDLMINSVNTLYPLCDDEVVILGCQRLAVAVCALNVGTRFDPPKRYAYCLKAFKESMEKNPNTYRAEVWKQMINPELVIKAGLE